MRARVRARVLVPVPVLTDPVRSAANADADADANTPAPASERPPPLLRQNVNGADAALRVLNNAGSARTCRPAALQILTTELEAMGGGAGGGADGEAGGQSHDRPDHDQIVAAFAAGLDVFEG